MLIIKHTKKTDLSPKVIWHVLEDVENWKDWDHGLEKSWINGPFIVGTEGGLKPLNGPLLPTTLTRVTPLEGFTQEAKLFMARAVMTHSISQSEGGTEITFQTEINGPLAFLWALYIGSSIRKKVPVEMDLMLETVKKLSYKL